MRNKQLHQLTKNSFNRYRVFHGFGQAKFADGGLILDPSQFTLLLKLPLKTMLSLKVVKIESKISNSLRKSNSVTHSVVCQSLLFRKMKKSVSIQEKLEWIRKSK